jgi:hypothetical protein
MGPVVAADMPPTFVTPWVIDAVSVEEPLTVACAAPRSPLIGTVACTATDPAARIIFTSKALMTSPKEFVMSFAMTVCNERMKAAWSVSFA